MLDALFQILCVLKQIPYFVLWAAITAFNAIIVALGLLLDGLLLLLPPFPEMPTLPAEFTTVMGWINWVFPVGTVISILASLAVLWLGWQAIAAGLRWARVLS